MTKYNFIHAEQTLAKARSVLERLEYHVKERPLTESEREIYLRCHDLITNFIAGIEMQVRFNL